jgi:hypothetical protein
LALQKSWAKERTGSGELGRNIRRHVSSASPRKRRRYL